MERWSTRTRTTLAVSVLALTLIAPWALGQDPDWITETHRLAEQGDAEAQFNLGFMYANGEGIPQDDAEAVRWFRLAAEQGHAEGQHSLGAMYYRGRGVREDDAEAARWYRLAADQGNAEAQLALGVMYATGAGVLKDDAEAARWVRLAAEQGDANAQAVLGGMYAFGEGVLKDDAEAARWVRLAAEQGDANAQAALGGMYAFGVGVLKDEAEAVRWYILAAEQGNAGAQFNLGNMYADGRGVLKDPVLAHMWFNVAGANGNEYARELRDILESDMTRAEISRATELARACMASDYQDCEPAASGSSSLYFTRGSHQDDVLRIQGTPSSINRLSDHEVWWYGVSTIDISLRDGRVREWNNLGGNLKVRLDPGPNVTDAQAFTRGSHREGVFQTGEITDLPMILFKVDPQYSEEARKAQYQGTVVLEAIIRSDGTIEILRVVRSLDFGLDENAIQALKQWKFRPGMRNGQPVDVVLNIEVNFNLR